MCQYHYIYAATCRHADFYRTSYCDRATAIGLPRHDGHSPNGDSANNTSGTFPGSPSSQPSASSGLKNSSSHSHTQEYSQNMSALTHSGSGTPFSKQAIPVRRDEQLPHNINLIPRSATGGNDLDLTLDHCDASSVLETQGYHDEDIDIASDTQSSSPLAGTRDEYHDDHTGISAVSLDHNTMSSTSTVRGPSSPRKPIPSQWLPSNSGPKLATAQRAKERGHKRGSVSGSPGEAKTLRGTRSSVDVGRQHGAEVPTFLTKEMLAAVETDITSPTNALGSTKRQITKPAWNSPKASDLRESPRQQSGIDAKTSPGRTTLLHTDAAFIGHKRGPSSVATSTDGTVFHSAAGSPMKGTTGLVSPVRSTAGSELSFKSSAEVLDDDDTHIPYLRLNADSEDEQKPRTVQSSSVKAATVGKASSSRPRLQIDTTATWTHSNTGEQSSTSATSSSAASNSPWSPTSASRIPRAAAGSIATSACGPTRSSTLKRTQSAKALILQHSNSQESQVTQVKSSTAVPVRHVRTVNSSGTTPIVSRKSTAESTVAPNIASILDRPADKASAQHVPDMVDQVASLLRRTSVDVRHERTFHDHGNYQAQNSRASSISTVKATPATQDLATLDSAIIYSKKSGASGTTLDRPFHSPPIIVMMAHSFDLGTFRPDNAHPEIATRTPSVATTEARGTSPTWYRKAESVHSMQPSLGSDLRATAPEFVPRTQPEPEPEENDADTPAPTNAATDLLGSRAVELDMYGVPWFHYMNQVQFAYQQGFQNGRSRSPKKYRTKKNRPSVSSPASAHPANDGQAEGTAGRPGEQRVSGMPPPASTLPLAEQRARQQREGSATGRCTPIGGQQNEDAPITDRPYSPFAAQKGIIAEQNALRNTTNTPRTPNVDLTSIRNVALPPAPRNSHPQSGWNTTLPNPGHHNARRYYNRSDNGLYSYATRGMVGVPMRNIAFPDPVPPQGRPAGPPRTMHAENGPGYNIQWPAYGQMQGSEACGAADVIVAAERAGGQACNTCVPDHALE